jgi:4-carboxymuconolactone decarboxylase
VANGKSKQQFDEIFGEAGQQVLRRISEYSPRLVEHIYDYIGGNLYQDPALDLRTRELCVISCLAAQGGLNEQLAVHVRTALRGGVKQQEIVSAIEAIGTYAGIPRALNALFTAIQIFEEQKR